MPKHHHRRAPSDVNLRGSALETGDRSGMLTSSMVQIGRMTDLTYNDWEYTNHAITVNGMNYSI